MEKMIIPIFSLNTLKGFSDYAVHFHADCFHAFHENNQAVDFNKKKTMLERSIDKPSEPILANRSIETCFSDYRRSTYTHYRT